MFRSISSRFLFAVALGVAVAACSDDDTPTTPTTPTTVTETLTGTITQNGVDIKSFPVSTSGAVTATLKTIAEDNTLVVGFSMGTWTGSSCLVILDNNAASGGAVLAGTMSAAGTLCLRMYDVGNVPAGAGVAYAVEIQHP